MSQNQANTEGTIQSIQKEYKGWLELCKKYGIPKSKVEDIEASFEMLLAKEFGKGDLRKLQNQLENFRRVTIDKTLRGYMNWSKDSLLDTHRGLMELGNPLEGVEELFSKLETLKSEGKIQSKPGFVYNAEGEEYMDLGDLKVSTEVSERPQPENKTPEKKKGKRVNAEKLDEMSFMSEFMPKLKTSKLFGRLLTDWEKQENNQMDAKTLMGEVMEENRMLFSSKILDMKKDEVEAEGVKYKDFQKFKVILLRAKINKWISTKKKFGKNQFLILFNEINEYNSLVNENQQKDVVQFLYENMFSTHNSGYEQDKKDLKKVYKEFYEVLFAGEGKSEIEMKQEVNKRLLQEPSKYRKIIGNIQKSELIEKYKKQEKGIQEIIIDFLKEPITKQLSAYNKDKKSIVEFLVNAEEGELEVLLGKSTLLAKEDVKKLQHMSDESETDLLEAFDQILVDKRQDALHTIKSTELVTDKEKFDDLYREYIAINRILGRKSAEKRSFFVDFQRTEGAEDKDLVIKSLLFINKNFKNLLSDQECARQIEKAKQQAAAGTGLDFSLLSDLEAKIDSKEGYDRQKMDKPLVNMAENYFLRDTKRNMDLLEKDANEIKDYLSKVTGDVNHFITDLISGLDTDEEAFFEKVKIADEKLQEEFKEYVKNYKDKKGIKKPENFVEFVVSIKAEEEKNALLEDGGQKNIFKAMQKYEMIRTPLRKKVENINVVEDYFKDLRAGDKKEKIDLLLNRLQDENIESFVKGLDYGDKKYHKEMTERLEKLIPEDEDNEDVIAKFLSEQDRKAKEKESDQVTKRDVDESTNKMVKDRMNVEQQKRFQFEKEYKVRGVNLLNLVDDFFKRDYVSILEKFNAGEFAGNQMINDLVGLRLLLLEDNIPEGEELKRRAEIMGIPFLVERLDVREGTTKEGLKKQMQAIYEDELYEFNEAFGDYAQEVENHYKTGKELSSASGLNPLVWRKKSKHKETEKRLKEFSTMVEGDNESAEVLGRRGETSEDFVQRVADIWEERGVIFEMKEESYKENFETGANQGEVSKNGDVVRIVKKSKLVTASDMKEIKKVSEMNRRGEKVSVFKGNALH